MAIRTTVDFSEVEEELMSKIGSLGLEITFDEEDNKIFNVNNKSNIFIIHSLNDDTLNTWGEYLKDYFENKNINIYSPKFPIGDKFTYEKFDISLSKYLEEKTLNESSIVVSNFTSNDYFSRFIYEHKIKPKVIISVNSCDKQPIINDEHLSYMKDSNILKYDLYFDEVDKTKKELIELIDKNL